MNKTHARRALLMSALSLLLCVSMLVGTTFAWFTDSVVSANNVIKSGNLDIEVQYTLDGENWKDLNGAKDLFQKDLWEPGHVEVVALKIENKGSLALKYTAGMNIVDEIVGKTKDGKNIVLSDILTVKTLALPEASVGDAVAKAFDKRDSALTYETNTAFKSASVLDKDQELQPGTAEYLIVRVEMAETVGNEANHDGVNAPSITFGINVMATQYTYEEDSFGKDYDEDAGYNAGKSNVGPYKLNVLSGGIATYDEATKTYDVSVASVAQGGYNASQGGYFFAGYTVNVAGYGENATMSFDKADGSGVTVWKLADEENDGFIKDGVHQQWTRVGRKTAYRYDIDGDGVTDFTVVNDVSSAVVEIVDETGLKNAIKAGNNITLGADVALTTNSALAFASGAEAVIDLNGHTLSAENTQTATHNFAIDVNGGNLTLKNGTVAMEHTGTNMGWNGATSVINVTAGGVLNLEGVTVKNEGGTDMNFAVHLNNWGDVTMNASNCVFEGTYCAVRVFNSGPHMNNIKITNSSLTGATRAFWVHNYASSDMGGKVYSGASATYDKAVVDARLNLDIYDNGNTFNLTGTAKSPIRYGFNEVTYFDASGNIVP